MCARDVIIAIIGPSQKRIKHSAVHKRRKICCAFPLPSTTCIRIYCKANVSHVEGLLFFRVTFLFIPLVLHSQTSHTHMDVVVALPLIYQIYLPDWNIQNAHHNNIYLQHAHTAIWMNEWMNTHENAAVCARMCTGGFRRDWNNTKEHN